MILELATFDIRPEHQAGFLAGFEVAQKILASMPGYVDHQLQQCIETDTRYRLLVHWRALEDHTVGFRCSTRFLEWRALLERFFAVPPDVEHYRLIAEGAPARASGGLNDFS